MTLEEVNIETFGEGRVLLYSSISGVKLLPESDCGLECAP